MRKSEFQITGWLTGWLGMVLGASLILGIATAPPAQAQRTGSQKAGDKVPGPKMSPKVQKVLQSARDLADAGKFPEAELALQGANEINEKTPSEQFQLDEWLGFVYLKQKKFNGAAAAYEKGLNSGLLPPAQSADRLRQLAALFLQTEPKELPKSGAYARRWLEVTGTRDPAMLGLVGQSAYFGDNFADAATYMSEAVAISKAAGQKPEESWLLIQQSASSKQGSNAGVSSATTDLLRYYPRKEHWLTLSRDLLNRAANKDRQILEVFRLLYQVDAMNQADDFTEAATQALTLGSPGEALKFMEKGYANGILSSSGNKAKSAALLADAKRLAALDIKTLPQFEKEALSSPAGEADVKLGEAFLSYDQPAKGLEAIERGRAKKGVKNLDEAGLSLGRAFILNGKPDQAVTAFNAVTGSAYLQLAQLWAIYASQL